MSHSRRPAGSRVCRLLHYWFWSYLQCQKENCNANFDELENSETYCYLGEVISRDGRNKANLAERFKKVKGLVRAIMTSAKTSIMKRIQTNVLLKLHKAETVPKFLYNAETWALNREEKKEADKMLLGSGHLSH